MELFIPLWMMVNQLKGAFSRERTFFWFVVVVLSFCVRQDSMGGVSSGESLVNM